MEDRLPALSAPARRSSVPRRLCLVLLAALLVTTLVTLPGQGPPARAGAPSRAEQLAFMWAMAGQESGWDYYARNPSSGAFGKYQIMPFNWPNWAALHLGDRWADQTPANQERVAYGKLRALYGWLGSWRRVAYWWLTGSTERNERRWSSYARGYVDNIMGLRKRAPRDGGIPRVFPSAASLLARGAWRRAGIDLRLRHRPSGRTWAREGRIRAGAVVRIRATRRTGDRLWLRIVSEDGRLGWVGALRTVPAHQPARPGRWADVRTDGPGRRDGKRDGKRDGRGRDRTRPGEGKGEGKGKGKERRNVRPRPR
jgi:hypothetical protein